MSVGAVMKANDPHRFPASGTSQRIHLEQERSEILALERGAGRTRQAGQGAAIGSIVGGVSLGLTLGAACGGSSGSYVDCSDKTGAAMLVGGAIGGPGGGLVGAIGMASAS